MHSTQSQQITSRHNELFHGPLWRHKQTQSQSLPPFLIRQGLKNIKELFTGLLLELQKWNFGQLLYDSGPPHTCSALQVCYVFLSYHIAATNIHTTADALCFFVVSYCSHTHPHHCRCALFFIVSNCSHTHLHTSTALQVCSVFVCYSHLLSSLRRLRFTRRVNMSCIYVDALSLSSRLLLLSLFVPYLPVYCLFMCYIILLHHPFHFIAGLTLSFLPSAVVQPNRCFPHALPHSHATFHSVRHCS